MRVCAAMMTGPAVAQEAKVPAPQYYIDALYALQVAENDAFIFDFDPNSAEIQVDGDNMILVFPDGGRIVLEGFFAPGGESG